MAITQAVAASFKQQLLDGVHDLDTGGNVFKLALYTANPYNTSSTVYSATSEVSSSSPYIGYTTTGKDLGSNAVVATTLVASCDFADAVWTTATFTAAYGAIYNDDKSNKLCVALDFDGNKTATAGTFTVTFPSPSSPADAIISMA